MVEIAKAIGVRRSALPGPEFEQYVNSNANKNEQTALHVAVQHGHVEAAKLLVRLGASVALRDVNGRSPLLYAARYGRMDLLQFFWEQRGAGAEEEKDLQGDGLLHLAATHDHPEAVRFGAAQGADVNAQNKFGETALHKAARTDNLAMVELLLQLGADSEVMGREGKPRHVAQSPAVAERLRGDKDKRGEPPRTQPRTPVTVVDVDALNAEEDEEVDNEEDDEDVEILIPGVRRIIASHGTSPNSELVHFKLRRRMEKESPSSLHHLTSVSDEQLAVQHEVMRKKSLASASFEALPVAERGAELAPPDAAAGVVIELTLASGSAVRPGAVTHLFEPYRGMFGRQHHTFVSRLFGSAGPGSLPIPAIASVAAVAEGGVHSVLLRSPGGYASFQLLADEVQHCREEAGCKLEEALRQVLERVLQCTEDLAAAGGGGGVVSPTMQRRPTAAAAAAAGPTTPKTQRVSVIRNLKNSLRGEGGAGNSGSSCGGGSGLWQLADSQSLKMELLALELKLGLPKALAVGVVLVQPGQDEATAMASNAMSKAAELFLASIATPTEALGYSGYAGGMSTKEPGTFYYLGWRGMEIVFHVAPLLSETQRRQFIGNDKVLLYLMDGWREGRQLQPRFRGQVNSVCLCVLPVAHPYYKVRRTVVSFVRSFLSACVKSFGPFTGWAWRTRGPPFPRTRWSWTGRPRTCSCARL